MKTDEDKSMPCVVRASALDVTQCSGRPELDRCTVIESVRKLMALGLLARDVRDLDTKHPTLQAILDYAQMDSGAGVSANQGSETVDATLKVIASQIQSLDIEIEMLNLRKRALKRRTRILEKLRASLDAHDDT